MSGEHDHGAPPSSERQPRRAARAAFVAFDIAEVVHHPDEPATNPVVPRPPT
jgi:hypothetical protein